TPGRLRDLIWVDRNANAGLLLAANQLGIAGIASPPGGAAPSSTRVRIVQACGKRRLSRSGGGRRR
ncbi:DUF350 domain-containing protein, partial [Micromonospora orduensis]|uniref:DUF350 domain-containing protein n=1 Tax=Micromonospora orduensis TaxID=1420891 RepID=UPI0033C69B0E